MAGTLVKMSAACMDAFPAFGFHEPTASIRFSRQDGALLTTMYDVYASSVDFPPPADLPRSHRGTNVLCVFVFRFFVLHSR
jgi:hypothetical protein